MNFEHEKTRGLSLAWYGVCIISELLFSIDKGNQAANGSRQAQRLNSHPQYFYSHYMLSESEDINNGE